MFTGVMSAMRLIFVMQYPTVFADCVHVYRTSLFGTMSSSGVNVSQLTDTELATMLRNHGVVCGPIIRKLVLIFRLSPSS